MSGRLTVLSSADLRIVKEMVFTVLPISAERAEHLGMVHHLIPAATGPDPAARSIRTGFALAQTWRSSAGIE